MTNDHTSSTNEGTASAVPSAASNVPRLRVDRLPICAKCGAPLHFVAHYGAPGRGQHWECDDGHGWAKLGDTFIDPAEGAHIMDPEQ